MNINPTTSITTANPSPAFRAVRFEPQNLRAWNEKVLAATLESKFVRNIIKKNEAVPQVDTLLSYKYSFYNPLRGNLSDAAYDRAMQEISENMGLSVTSGSKTDLDINVSRHPGWLVSDKERVLADEVVGKIKEFDREFEINNKIQEKLDEIKKISANVIYTME